ncbi:TRIO and F-actin binding protein b isoform X1 [Syngnathoides biaculeatus]|uniref:TRIO and F-actin binding protein b isoform X1 n=1 Tax=Syngnathoides biaculeatus TaxID=300417 RepID=UPI002ADE73E4|nr:TRIO and F-actin binding protein b isoform X1 [Syngnathoides biaculeatus]
MCLLGADGHFYPGNKKLPLKVFSAASNDYDNSHSTIVMPLADDETVCPEFQPNIFDPSRCHSCLRQRHLHRDTEAGPQPKSNADSVAGAKCGTGPCNGTLPPIPSQSEERDTSTSKEDSEHLSVVSSYCDVTRGSPGQEEGFLCILSPDCELYIGDTYDNSSTDSCLDPSEYQELSGSGSAEDEYTPQRMTRLDLPPHRPTPRAWMDEAHSRDSFNSRLGFKEDREKRESGYFSLGRVAGTRASRDKSPQAPFRHLERGHPIFSPKNIEPKDTIPFRNPNLGLASERQVPEVLDKELPVEIPPPDPYDIALEVEAQVGARSPSPTPFKIAESLVSVERKGFINSYGRGNASFNSSYKQFGRFDSSLHGSVLQSRSSSPTLGSTRLWGSDFPSPIRGNTIDGRGRSQGIDPQLRASMQGSYGQRIDFGTFPRKLKTLSNSVKSQYNRVCHFGSAVQKTEVGESHRGLSIESRTSSPGKALHRKTENTIRSLDRFNSHTTFPSYRPSESHYEIHGSSPTTMHGSSGQSVLRKSESFTSLDGRNHHGRCGSPIREGYDIESQALLRNRLNSPDHENPSGPTTGHCYSVLSQPKLHKTEFNTVSRSRGLDSCSERRSCKTAGQYSLRKTASSTSFNSHECRNSSPSGRGYEPPAQSILRKSEVKNSDSRSSLPSSPSQSAPHQTSFHKKELSSSIKFNNHNSRNSSPSRNATNDPAGYSILRKATNQRKSNYTDSKSAPNRSKCSWRGSTHSLPSSSLSRAASPTVQNVIVNRKASVTLQTPRSPGGARSKVGRYVLEDRYTCPNDRRPHHARRSPSPTPRTKMQHHTLLESSMDSSESVASTGRSNEAYAVVADLPKVKKIHQMDDHSHIERPQNPQRSRRQELFKPASHSLSKHPSREWEDTRETERELHYGSSGYLARAHSSSSLQRSCSPTGDESSSWRDPHHRSEPMQPDLLNFKKGWMSKLDDCGEWKKHWFVLTDAGLKYYRDSSAEEKDDLDGEIDLKSCVKVSEFDVEKNYGFQIQTREAMFTLSAMTAGIRRNWIEVLKKCIRPSTSPDITQLPDSSSDKENSHSRLQPSSRRPSSRHGDVSSEIPPTQRRFDYVELSPVPASSSHVQANQSEIGEGQQREHSHWQEDKTRDATCSQWEAVLSRKGTSSGVNQRLRMEEEIEKKWAEFERMPLKEKPIVASSPSSQSANEALQREVASLRHQLEQLQQGGGRGGVGGLPGGCGPNGPCGRSLTAMDRAHRQAMEELQRQHERQMAELEMEKNRLLLEEIQDTSRVMEALKKKHKEELEREVEKVNRLSSGLLDPQTLRILQQAESQALQRELGGLSERYSQKCLELNRAEQNNAERERELSQKERDLEQLKKENQNLKDRLAEEVSRIRCINTDMGSKENNKTPSELEVLLRVKEKEIEYLHKEINCLRNELQFLNTEKRLAGERFAEINEELSGIKGRSEREIQSLKEHLRLAMAALQEGQRLGNSMDH